MTLFVLVSLKTLMAKSSTLFLVEICASRFRDDSVLFDFLVIYGTSLFLLVLTIYFLLKDSVYLSRAFKSVLPIAAFAICLVSVFIFFSSDILPRISHQFDSFLESLMSVKVFVPYLIIRLIIYLKIIKNPIANEAKEFSFYNYFALHKRKGVLVLALVVLAGVFCMTAMFTEVALNADLFRALIASFYVVAPPLFMLLLPLLFFGVPLVSKKTLLIALCAFIICFAIWFYFGAIGFYYAMPLSLIFCVILKFQQYSFTKISLLLTIATCVLFGYLVFPY
jgi:hypothetical protein